MNRTILLLSYLISLRWRYIFFFLLCSAPLALSAAEDSLHSLYNFQSRMAAQGSSEAMIKLGEMSEDGLGTEKSDERASEWYQRALAKGHPEAQPHLDKLRMKQDQAVALQRAAQEKAAREQAARAQALQKEAVAREQAAREKAVQEEAAKQQAATRKTMSPEEKALAREEAVRRAEEAYQQSLEKQIAQERAESEALKRSRNAAAK